jgi:hypothetical protein
LGLLSIPVSVVHGADVPIIPTQTARDFATRTTDVDLRVIKGLSYDLPSSLVLVFVQAIVSAATIEGRCIQHQT